VKRLVFTGGHHTSALVVAKELILQGKYKVVWFGHRYSMWGDKSDSAEYKEVIAAGIKFYDLKAGKFYNTFNPLKLIRIPWGFIQAFYFLLKIHPAGIVSFGGYLAVPTVITGWLLGIPSVTHEQTMVAGWANRLIANFSRKIAITWPESAKFYPKSKTILTGLPLRLEIIQLKNQIDRIPNTCLPAGKAEHRVIYITGGKQGSHLINQIVFSILPELVKKYTVIHQTGSSSIHNDYQHALDLVQKNYEVFDFDSQKAIKALKLADIVIGRAGAHTIYELAVLGKKCILIPIPWVSHNEQLINAQMLENSGLATVIPEDKLNGERILMALQDIQKRKIQALNLPLDATKKLVDLINSNFN